MNRNMPMPSLLPFLESDHTGFRIDFTAAEYSTGAKPRHLPFRILDDTSPLTRLLKAKIITAAENTLQSVFVLLQKDHTTYTPSELRPLTNPDIEACWQQAHAFFSKSDQTNKPSVGWGRPLIHLVDERTIDGEIRPFQSVFYCNHRHLFFHPPCPSCGGNLSLCTDDEQLSAQGLAPYTSSLRRYLYCASCPPTAAGNGFYVPFTDPTDPAGIQDCSNLIVAWRRLFSSQAAPEGFPCIDCPERNDCHGPENLSALRLAPLGFFPFHMLLFQDMTLRAADFLPLVSGASLEEIDARLLEQQDAARLSDFRQASATLGNATPFFFNDSEKHFLEILYLKLAFLEEISDALQKGPAPLDIPSALSHLWVKIANQNPHLPRLWNFTTGYMDIGFTDKSNAVIMAQHPNQLTYFLGIVWFYTLTANKTRSAAKLLSELSRLLELCNENKEIPLIDQASNESTLFSPSNIYWAPEAQKGNDLSPHAEDPWKKSLEIACALLTAGRRESTDTSWETLRRKVRDIREEIKKQLFIDSTPLPVAGIRTAEDEDRAIYNILTNIIRGDGPLETAPASASRQGETAAPESPVNTAQIAKETAEPELVETIILAREKTGQPLDETATLLKKPAEEALAETIIVSKKPDRETLAETTLSSKEPDEETLAETIVLNPRTEKPANGGAEGAPAETPPDPNTAAPTDEDDILSETVILRHSPENDEGDIP